MGNQCYKSIRKIKQDDGFGQTLEEKKRSSASGDKPVILCISNVLTPNELQQIHTQLAQAEFVDGKITAGRYAQQVKHNTQLDNHSSVAGELRQIVNTALMRSSLFQMAVRPQRILPALFSRYEVGMSYGSHTDNAVMSFAPDNRVMLRSDVSLTLFLNDPAEYEGGRLIIESSHGTQGFKLEAGAMIVYPSSTLHCVELVTQGVRLAAVTWVQSLIRDANQREILFDLDRTRQFLFEKYGKTTEFDLLCKSSANLLRHWADC